MARLQVKTKQTSATVSVALTCVPNRSVCVDERATQSLYCLGVVIGIDLYLIDIKTKVQRVETTKI